MAKDLLTTVAVHKAKDGDLRDGAGLSIKIKAGKARAAFRYTSPAGVRREMGLGVVHRNDLATTGTGLKMVRDAAERARRLLAESVDPIDKKSADRMRAKAEISARKTQTKAEVLTLARVAREYHERVIEPTKSDLHAKHWISSLENHVPLEVWGKPIAEIDAPMLLQALSKVRALDDVRKHVPETLQRVRQRLDAVWEDAIFYKRATTNPAMAIRRKMREQAPRRERGSFAALPYVEVPAFVRDLRLQDGVAARALEFALLTGSRTGEVLGAKWEEFNLDARVWTIPGTRMKGHEAHVVYLSDQALMVLAAVAALDSKIVFPSPLRGEPRPLSNMALLTTLQRMKWDAKTTVHGICRSSFSTWANETGAARPDVVEASLAHKERDRVKAAYNRSQFLAERRALLDAWADFCDGKIEVSNAVPTPARAA